MRFSLLLLITAVAVGIIWLCAGRYLTLLIDQIVTVRIASVPVNSLEYDGGGFRAGELSMTFGSLDNQRFDLTLHSDASNRVVLTSGGRSFILGPRTNPVDPSGRPEIYFIPEPGDELSFTTTRSILSWPTPFEFNIMMRSPWWKRYVYYRLVWKKRSGAELAMLWRYEQDYYAGSGWTTPAMMWNFQTGLRQVDIHPQASSASGGS
jgi:hypothetical protein